MKKRISSGKGGKKDGGLFYSIITLFYTMCVDKILNTIKEYPDMGADIKNLSYRSKIRLNLNFPLVRG